MNRRGVCFLPILFFCTHEIRPAFPRSVFGDKGSIILSPLSPRCSHLGFLSLYDILYTTVYTTCILSPACCYLRLLSRMCLVERSRSSPISQVLLTHYRCRTFRDRGWRQLLNIDPARIRSRVLRPAVLIVVQPRGARYWTVIVVRPICIKFDSHMNKPTNQSEYQTAKLTKQS